MNIPFLHPSYDQLSALADEALPASRRDRVAAHVRACIRCQESLRFLKRLDTAGAGVPTSGPSPDLLQRVLASREAGERHIFPITSDRSPARRAGVRAIVAALTAAGVLAIVLARSNDLVAEGADSELRTTPTAPKPGDRIEVAYRPATGLFHDPDSLILRGRLRTAKDRSYSSGIPAQQTQTLGVLRKARNGEWRTSFTLPKDVVLVSFAVESPDASVVDVNGMRLWEVMAHGADGRPVFEALDQRSHEMMGRSWDEAYRSAKRATELHPDVIGGWASREFFEKSMFGEETADSIARAYAAKRDALIETARAGGAITENDLESVFFRAAVAARRESATQADKDAFDYWYARIRREHPRHPQIAQYVAMDFPRERWLNDPRYILDSLERAYPNLVPLRGPGFNLTNSAMQAATQLKDEEARRRWYARMYVGSRDSAKAMAMFLANSAETRKEGIEKLRVAARGSDEQLVAVRSVFWNRDEYRRRVDDARREILVRLGQALVADGQTRAGVDTLTLASQGVWNVQIFRSLIAGYRSAGDTANALRISAKLAVDPRTPADTVSALTLTGRQRMGTASWDSAMDSARSDMHTLLRQRSKLRTLKGVPSLNDSEGVAHKLADLTKTQPAVVILWSRGCGWAVDALPQILAMASRLHAAGTPVLLVNTEPYSKAVADFLAEKKWTLPVYWDTRGEIGNAFNAFGVPAYYVLDDAGRIRFDSVDGVSEVIAQVGALK